MARPTNTDERRAQISKALMKVMSTRGYEGASIAQVAKAARLTPGLVHYHFKNKQEVLLCSLRELVARHHARLDERLTEAQGDPLAELAIFIDFHLAAGRDADPEALACWILVGGEALREAKIRAAYQSALESLVGRAAEILRRGVERRLFRCASIEAAASAIMAIIQGYFALAAGARDVIPRGSAATTARLMVEGLLQIERRSLPRKGAP